MAAAKKALATEAERRCRPPRGTSVRSVALNARMRQSQLQRRLDGLEKDNYTDHGALPTSDDTVEGDEDRSKRKATRKGPVRRVVKPLAQLIEEAQLATLPPHVPTYLTTPVGPSTKPRRFFCSVCGYDGPYTCTLCGERFCSTACNATHKETRCLRFTT